MHTQSVIKFNWEGDFYFVRKVASTYIVFEDDNFTEIARGQLDSEDMVTVNNKEIGRILPYQFKILPVAKQILTYINNLQQNANYVTV